MTDKKAGKGKLPDEGLFPSFVSLFKVIEAAGGIVKNDRNECLFILRRGKWDLPKGKVQESEPATLIKEPYDKAAIREVMEETGIRDIRIIKELPLTYHIYKQKEKWVLKPTTWFEMFAPGDQELIPEVKEDIEKVKWVKQDEIKIIADKTYASVREFLILAIPLLYPPGT